MKGQPTGYRKLRDTQAIVDAVEGDLRDHAGPSDIRLLLRLALLLASAVQPLRDGAMACVDGIT